MTYNVFDGTLNPTLHLIECSDFSDIHIKYFVTSTMKDLFEHVSMRNVINFIKETHFII